MLARLLEFLLGWVPDDLFDVDLGDLDEPPARVMNVDIWDLWLRRLIEDEA